MYKFFIASSAIIVGIGVFSFWQFSYSKAVVPTEPLPPVVVLPTPPVVIIDPIPEPVNENGFERITLTSTRPGSELAKLVGLKDAFTVLAINRIDDKNLTQGMSLVVPTSFDDPNLWEFMPEVIDSAQTIPKLILVSQETQAFGFYEYGQLVRSGPVSSGKFETQTPSGFYFTNWKGREVISTFSEEWILKWNFNINNDGGIALHQYALPGYPASHSCVRLYEADAMWLYNWANQWVLASDGQTKLASGTPVIIFGTYDFDNEAPWKNLPTDPAATKVDEAEVADLVYKNLPTIESEQALREQVLAGN